MDPIFGLFRAPVSDGTEVASGCRRDGFFVAKSFVSRDGMPAVVDHWHSTCCCREDGSDVLSRVMRRISQGLRGWSRGEVSIFSGVMIHRTTLDTIKGFNEVDLRALRKPGTVVDCVSDMRWMSARGMLRNWEKIYQG